LFVWKKQICNLKGQKKKKIQFRGTISWGDCLTVFFAPLFLFTGIHKSEYCRFLNSFQLKFISPRIFFDLYFFPWPRVSQCNSSSKYSGTEFGLGFTDLDIWCLGTFYQENILHMNQQNKILLKGVRCPKWTLPGLRLNHFYMNFAHY
jgi:hypothetical protein